MAPITYLEIDGGRLAVEVEGQGPLVVCQPAMSDTRDAYGPLAAQLVAAGYRVALFDMRGHGDSSATFRRYGDEASADDFLAVVDAFGGGRPAVLVGASLASGAAVIAAGRAPEKVAGLVLIAAFLRSPSGKFAFKAMQSMLWKPWGPAFWGMYAPKLWPGLGEEGSKARAKEQIAQMTRPGYWEAFQSIVAGADHSKYVGPWVPRVRNVKALVVVGDADPDWSAPLDEAKWVAAQFADAENLNVAGAGHAPQYEKPEVVSPAVLRFLNRIDFKKTDAAKRTAA